MIDIPEVDCYFNATVTDVDANGIVTKIPFGPENTGDKKTPPSVTEYMYYEYLADIVSGVTTLLPKKRYHWSNGILSIHDNQNVPFDFLKEIAKKNNFTLDNSFLRIDANRVWSTIGVKPNYSYHTIIPNNNIITDGLVSYNAGITSVMSALGGVSQIGSAVLNNATIDPIIPDPGFTDPTNTDPITGEPLPLTLAEQIDLGYVIITPTLYIIRPIALDQFEVMCFASVTLNPPVVTTVV